MDKSSETGDKQEPSPGHTEPDEQSQQTSDPAPRCTTVKQTGFKQEPSPGHTEPDEQSQQTSDPAPRRTTVKQEKDPHVNHSFQWCVSDKHLTSLTCPKSGSIEDSLRRSRQFQELLRKNKNKELVIVKDGRAISSHFPCSLIKEENLRVEFIKSSDEPAEKVSGKRFSADELVTFHVLTKGGKNVMTILKNKELDNFDEISVYAVRGETVRRALRRDGRFLEVVFDKNCALLEKNSRVRTEMLALVDNLDGKAFKIVRIPGPPPPKTPPESLEDAYVPQSESQGSACEESCDAPQQPVPTESVTDKKKEKTERKDNIQPEMIPTPEALRCALASIVTDYLKGLKPGAQKAPHFQKVFREEFGKNKEACSEVKTMKKMMEHSDSVCLIRVNDRPEGSGFLLFGNFVLTNGHVVKDVLDMNTGRLTEKMTVHFSYMSHGQVGPGAVVEEVTGGEYGDDVSGHMYDWALLKISVDQELQLPCPLLTHFGFLFKRGGICIIGHPEGGVKKVDTCWIIPTDKHAEVAGRHYNENPRGALRVEKGLFPLVTPQFFKDVPNSIQREVVTYESCFYHVSSGSPVFDQNCNVVAMHSGGFAYKDIWSWKINSVIEFGYPLSFILEHIIIQMVERQRFDVLKAYLDCGYSKHQNVMINVKKLIESRNLISSLQQAYAKVAGEKSLMQVFEFFLQKEEPVSMDLSCESFSTEVLREKINS